MISLKHILFLTFILIGVTNTGWSQNTYTGVYSGEVFTSLENDYYKAEYLNGNIVMYKNVGLLEKNWKEFFQYKVGGAILKVQGDGNMVAYDLNGNAVWSTGTNGRGGKGTFLILQSDGNLVLYNGTWLGTSGDALWATGTCKGKENGCGSVGTR